MRTWKIADLVMYCGRCIVQIHRGQPVQLIQVAALKHPKVRCVACADGVPPEGLQARQVLTQGTPAPAGMTRLGSVVLPFDGRLAALGKDGE